MRDLAIHEANEQQSVAKSKQIQHAVVSVILIFIGVAIALISIGNPMGLICGGTCAVLGVVAALSAGFGDRREGSLRACPKCGYNLTGAVTPGCPECGWKLDELLTEPVSKK